MEERVCALEKRVKIAERRNNELRMLTALMVLSSCLLLVVGQSHFTANAQGAAADTVTARGFVLVDTYGQKRASLEIVNNQPELVLFADDGTPQIELSMREGIPGIGIQDVSGRLRIWLALVQGQPALMLSDENQRVRASLALLESKPALSLFDDKMQVRASLVDTPAGPGLGLADTRGVVRMAVAVTMAGPQVCFYDSYGRMSFLLP